MPFDNTPNKLESPFFQRNATNAYYEQINISGSDLIVYHSSSGELTADRISVWATKYGLGNNESASYALTASYALNGGGGTGGVTSGSSYNIYVAYAVSASSVVVTTVSASWASSSIQAQYSTRSLFAVSASWASSSIQAQYATQSLFAISASWASSSLFTNIATSASWASSSISASCASTSSLTTSASYAITASYSIFALASGSLTDILQVQIFS
jgi:hypothetical protein